MLGKWNNWYKNVRNMSSFRYGNTITYRLAAEFLKDLSVEDWGCGAAGFKKYHTGGYFGLDGSDNPFVGQIVDLRKHRSFTDGLLMRHVLEHNYDWKDVLENAVASFQKRFCLILFTPFADQTKEIAHNRKHGVDAPDISFKKEDIEQFFKGLKWRMEEHKTETHYGVEYIYYVEK